MAGRQTELKNEYKQTKRPMGVYQIRNQVNGKVFIGRSLDLPGILNRHKFELTMGSHRNKALQGEWREFGAEKFLFEILDELKPAREGPHHDDQEDLAALEALWLDKLLPYGDRGYNAEGK